MTTFAAIEAAVQPALAANFQQVHEGATLVEEGFAPGGYGPNLWTRDHAVTIWHHPTLLTAAQRRQFVTHRLAKRTTGAEVNPYVGGFYPPNFCPDYIHEDGAISYKNSTGTLPIFDDITMVILVLWTDWNLTADSSTFTANKEAIDACLAAIPRDVNGAVWSDPAAPSTDWGATDGFQKTGAVGYGSMLQCWAYKMLAEISGENGSGPYSTLRAAAEAGLATLRKPNGFYMASSVSDTAVDDVWATALVAAEGLAPDAECIDSAAAIVREYRAGTITQNGWVCAYPDPIGRKFWSWAAVEADPGVQFSGAITSGQRAGSGQDGGFWIWPLWDCIRACELVDQALADLWVAEAMTEIARQYRVEGSDGALVPYEWSIIRPEGPEHGTKGYSACASIAHRFASRSYPAGWLTGTGDAGSPAGDGNRDVYLGADGVPTAAGCAYLLKQAQFAIRPPATPLIGAY